MRVELDVTVVSAQTMASPTDLVRIRLLTRDRGNGHTQTVLRNAAPTARCIHVKGTKPAARTAVSTTRLSAATHHQYDWIQRCVQPSEPHSERRIPPRRPFSPPASAQSPCCDWSVTRTAWSGAAIIGMVQAPVLEILGVVKISPATLKAVIPA